MGPERGDPESAKGCVAGELVEVSLPLLKSAGPVSAASCFSSLKICSERSSRATRGGHVPVGVASSHLLTWTAAMRSRCGGRLPLIHAGAQRLIAGVQGSSAGSRNVPCQSAVRGNGRPGRQRRQPRVPESAAGAGKLIVPASERVVSATDSRSRVADVAAQADRPVPIAPRTGDVQGGNRRPPGSRPRRRR